MSAQGRAWYAEMCRRPEWQKKRLEILERDDWRCQRCGDKDKMLTVHHWYYKRGAMPWDYPDNAFETLCQECHTDMREYQHKLVNGLLDGIFQRFGPGGASLIANAVGDDAIDRIDGETLHAALETAALWLSPELAEEHTQLEIELAAMRKRREQKP